MISLTAYADSESKDCTNLTAKQIVSQIKKTVPVGKVKKFKKSEMALGKINSYTSKYSFYDKKYKKVYCTIEVFKTRDDAIRRAGYIDCLSVLYETFGQKEEVPLVAYQYKNVAIRVGSKMPYKRAKKYYNAMKKIVDKSISKSKKTNETTLHPKGEKLPLEVE